MNDWKDFQNTFLSTVNYLYPVREKFEMIFEKVTEFYIFIYLKN